MAMVRVKSLFYDLVERVDRFAGDVFEADDKRAAYLADVLGSEYVEVVAESPNLGGLTKAQLLEIAAERGVEVPEKSTKAQIIELLGG